MHDDWSVERLDAELARLGAWTAAPVAHDGAALAAGWPESGRVEVHPSQGVAALLTASAREALFQGLHGKALWLSDDGEGRPLLRLTAGLPSASEFPTLVSRTADIS